MGANFQGFTYNHGPSHLLQVFLQHLPSLCQLKDSFDTLWMNILQFMEKFLHLENESGLLVSIN